MRKLSINWGSLFKSPLLKCTVEFKVPLNVALCVRIQMCRICKFSNSWSIALRTKDITSSTTPTCILKSIMVLWYLSSAFPPQKFSPVKIIHKKWKMCGGGGGGGTKRPRLVLFPSPLSPARILLPSLQLPASSCFTPYSGKQKRPLRRREIPFYLKI